MTGDTEVAPGVTACGTGAHCPGHQVLRVESEGQVLAGLSDLLPTRWHLRLAWMMSYDVEPMAVLEHKRRLLAQACDGGWTLFLSHDPDMPFIRLTRKDEKEYDCVPA